ncbi:hypothetical protein H2199_007427 [Coniosporium tulheliwenetii]|uniref:Uncharacterized protein n=1 Tax=Coniosporium tulheliwenetii TaxID=3383036 RepID=A0ACC2YQ64_9PEZI|nr:hypothetical protein H2199_007427 [Cladosporium sp. JES 115]
MVREDRSKEAVPSRTGPKISGESTHLVDAEKVPDALRFTEPLYHDRAAGNVDVTVVHKDYRQRDSPIMKGDFPAMDAKVVSAVYLPGQNPPIVSCIGGKAPWLRSSFSLHTQYPSVNLHIKRSAGGEVTVRFFPTCLYRGSGTMGFRFFEGGGGSAIPEDRAKINDEMADLITNQAYFETCLGLRAPTADGLNAPVWSGIDKGRLDELETQAKAGHKLTDADALIVALRRSVNLSIITKRALNSTKNVDAMTQFVRYFRTIMWLCVSSGCNWFYRLQSQGKRMSDHDYPFELSLPPRWLVQKFNVSSVGKTFTKLAPAQWASFGPCMDYPDAETLAFVLRLALHREKQHKRRIIENIEYISSGGDNGPAYATFMSSKGFPDSFLVKLTLGHSVDASDYTNLILPKTNTKLKLCYSIPRQRSWTFAGQIVDIHSASDIVCAVFAPPGRTADIPLDKPVQVSVELEDDLKSAARCIAAVEEISRGHKRSKGVDLPAVVLGAPAKITETGSLAKVVTDHMVGVFNKELKAGVELNGDQKAAARDTLTSSTGVSIIEGPPGTGKTSTLMAAVAGHVMAGKAAKNPANRRKVLVCAPSNQAVDACLANFSMRNSSKIKVVRFRGAFAKSSGLKAHVSATKHADNGVEMAGAADSIEPPTAAVSTEQVMSGTDGSTAPPAAAQPAAEPASGEPDTSVEQMTLTEGEPAKGVERKLVDEELERQARIRDVMLDIKKNSNSLDHTDLAFNRQRQRDIEEWSNTQGHPMQKDAARYLSVQEQLRGKKKTNERKQLRVTLVKLEKVLTEKFCEGVDVVFVTCNTSCHQLLMDYFKFNVILVDESGQSTTPDTAIPLAAFKESVELVILGGDRKQMQPVVLSKGFNEGFEALSVSLFQRLIEDSSRRYPVQTLRKQYGMDPQISALPSKEFYTEKAGANKPKISNNNKKRQLHGGKSTTPSKRGKPNSDKDTRGGPGQQGTVA